MYVVIVVVFSGELEDLVMHSIMTYNYESSMDASKSMKYVKVLREYVAFYFQDRGVNTVTYAQKSQNYLAASTVPVTVVLHMVSQEPMCLTRRMRRWSGVLIFLTSPPSLASLKSSCIYFRAFPP